MRVFETVDYGPFRLVAGIAAAAFAGHVYLAEAQETGQDAKLVV